MTGTAARFDIDELVPILPAPANPNRRGPWREFLHRWRAERRRQLRYDGGAYERPELAWTRRCFAYEPLHSERFLAHWRDAEPPAARPVVYVDLDDARAFAAWAGKRLPTEEEWQHAMQSHELDPGDPRVWNWTESERSDGRTRYCVLKGGADFHADGSVWYADGGPKPPEFGAKFILTWPGLDRCETIGFRCVVDVAG